jgi:hypothetical protein
MNNLRNSCSISFLGLGVIPANKIKVDSKLLSGFPIRGHRIPDNNLESHCITVPKNGQFISQIKRQIQNTYETFEAFTAVNCNLLRCGAV